MDVAAVRQGLAQAASAVTGLNCLGYVPDSVPEPCFYAGEVEIDYDQTFQRGMDLIVVDCRLLVSRADDRSGQKALDAYLKGAGPTSVKAAIEGTPGVPQTLGGACHDLQVFRVNGYRFYPVGEDKFYGARLRVRVIGEGD